MQDVTRSQPFVPLPAKADPTRIPTRAAAYLLFLTVLVANVLGQTVVGSLGLAFPIAVTISEVLFILVPVLLFLRLGNYDVRATLSLNPTTPQLLLLSAGAAVLAWPLAEVLGIATEKTLQIVGRFPDPVPKPQNDLEAIAYLFALTIVPGICEELLNRGVLQRAFSGSGMWRTVIYVGIFFAVFHLAAYPILFTFMLGMVLSYIVFQTGSIYNSMLCHTIFNSVTAVLILLDYFNILKVNEDLSWLLPLAIVTTPLLLGVLFYIGKLTSKQAGTKAIALKAGETSVVRGRFIFAEAAVLTVIGAVFILMVIVELGTRYICAHPQLAQTYPSLKQVIDICPK